MSRRQKPTVGQRCSVQDRTETGTIRFVGTTKFSTGIWVGIELDTPTGKNDGSIKGVRYFQVAPNHGLFVKPTQVILNAKSTPAPSSASKPSRLRKPSTTSTPSTSKTQAQQTPSQTPKTKSEPTVVAATTPAQPQTPAASKQPAPETPIAVDVTPKTSVPKQHLPPPTPTPFNTPTTTVAETKPEVAATPVATPVATPIKPATPVDESKQTYINQLLATIKQLEEEKTNETNQNKSLRKQVRELTLAATTTQSSSARELELETKEKQTAREIANLKNEIEELNDRLEMLALDKEFAEEKTESLQAELGTAQHDVEMLKLELESLKESNNTSEGAGQSDDAAAVRAQNEKLTAALLQMKTVYVDEKTKREAAEQALESAEKLAALVPQLKADVNELKTQLDARDDDAGMIERLSERNMVLEQKLEEQAEEMEDLIAMKDAADDLEESLTRAEREARLELHARDVELLDAQDREKGLRQRNAELEAHVIRLGELTKTLQRDAAARAQDLARQQAGSDDDANDDDTPARVPMTTALMTQVVARASAPAVDAALSKVALNAAEKHRQLAMNLIPDSMQSDIVAVNTLATAARVHNKAQLLGERAELALATGLDDSTEQEHDDAIDAMTPSLTSDEATCAIVVARQCQRLMAALNSAVQTLERSPSSEAFLKAAPVLNNELVGTEARLDALLQLARDDALLDAHSNAAADARSAAALAETALQLVAQQLETQAYSAPLASLADTVAELTARTRLRLVRSRGSEGVPRAAIRTAMETARQLQRAIAVELSANDTPDAQQQTAAPDADQQAQQAQTTLDALLPLAGDSNGNEPTTVDDAALAQQLAQLVALVRGGALAGAGRLSDEAARAASSVRADVVKQQLSKASELSEKCAELEKTFSEQRRALSVAEKARDDAVYSIETLKNKFEKARQAETKALDDLKAVEAKVSSSEEASLSALNELRAEQKKLERENKRLKERLSSGGLSATDDEQREGRVERGVTSTPVSRQLFPVGAKASASTQSRRARSQGGQALHASNLNVDAGWHAERSSLLASLSFLRAENARLVAAATASLHLPPALPRASLTRPQHAHGAAVLNDVRRAAASARVVELGNDDVPIAAQLAARRATANVLSRRVASLHRL